MVTTPTSRGFEGLARKAKSSLEESGSTSLFVGFGTLKWELEGDPMESPLILAPVRLTGGTGRNKVFELAWTTVVRLLRTSACWRSSTRNSSSRSLDYVNHRKMDMGSTSTRPSSVREALLQRAVPFAVEEGLVLGNFQFSTFRIWKDVDDHWARSSRLPWSSTWLRPSTRIYLAPRNTYPDVDLPLPADESQYEAIQAAIAGETFVLEGPPGTGKSQTITNIIAGALGAGNASCSSRKAGCTEVVKQRLDQVGVGAFSLDLHGRTRKRAEVAALIREGSGDPDRDRPRRG